MSEIPVQWDGESFVPARNMRRVCDQEFVVGKTYIIDAILSEAPSKRMRGRYFAILKQGWENLPEGDERFPTAEHLRKWCLIKTGYYDVRTMVASSSAEAQRIAAFMRGGTKRGDDYMIVTVVGNVVQEFRAKSQTELAMDKQEFRESAEKVLDLVASMIGVETSTLVANLGKAD